MYTPTSNIDRKRALADALRKTPSNAQHWTQALAHALSQGMAGHQDYLASKAESENEDLKNQEMQTLAQVLSQGGMQGPTQDGSTLAPQFSHPDVQASALSNQLQMAQAEHKANLNPGGGEFGVSPIWLQNEDGSYGMGQLNKAGGLQPVNIPEGMSVIPDSGRMGFDPSMIDQRAGAETQAEVENIEATAEPQANAAALEAATVGEVENRLAADRTYTQKDIEREFARGAAQKSVDYASSQLELLKEDAQRLLDHEGLEGAFGWDNFRSKIPGTAAADAAAILDTIKNKNFITALGAMREASKTGGAVGNVSNAEGGRFENALVALGQAQSDEQIKQELQRLINIVDESVGRMRSAFETEYGNNQYAPETNKTTEPEELPPVSGGWGIIR